MIKNLAKYLFILLLIAILSSVIFRKNILELALNHFTASQSITITTLQGLDIQFDHLHLDQLVLQFGENNATQTFDNINLSYSLIKLNINSISVENWSFEPPQLAANPKDSKPPQILQLLNQWRSMPITEITVNTLSALNKKFTLQFQHSVQGDEIHLSEARRDLAITTAWQNNNFTIKGNLSIADLPVVKTALSMTEVDQDYLVEGQFGIDVNTLTSFPELLNMLPPEISALAGTINGSLAAKIDKNIRETESYEIKITLQPDTMLSGIYNSSSFPLASSAFDIKLDEALVATYHSNQNMMVNAGKLLIDLQHHSFTGSSHLLVDNIECQHIDACVVYLNMHSSINNLDHSALSIVGAELLLTATINLSRDTFNINIDSPATLSIKQLQHRAATWDDLQFTINNVSASVSPQQNSFLLPQAEVVITSAKAKTPQNITLTQNRMALAITQGTCDFAFACSANSTVNFSTNKLQLDALLDETLSADKVTLTSELALSTKDQHLQITNVIPLEFTTASFVRAKTRFKQFQLMSDNFHLQLMNDDLTVTGDLIGSRQQQLLSYSLHHHLTQEKGQAEVKIPQKQFDSQTKKLSKYFTHWPFEFDILSGNYTADANFSWQKKGQKYAFTGSTVQHINNLSGFYGKIAFIDANTFLDAIIDDGRLTTLKPVVLTLKSLDIGFPVYDIKTSLTMDANASPIFLQPMFLQYVDANVLGGKVRIDNYAYPEKANQPLILKIKNLQLADALSLAAYEEIEGNGSISGQLPFHIRDDGTTMIVTMDDGLLESDGPGFLRYKARGASMDVTKMDPQLKIVYDALSNYHFNTLSSGVIYRANGDLELAMKLKGFNPDLAKSQPINLNLNVSDNIPELLKSLQAGRVVTDTLQVELQKKMK